MVKGVVFNVQRYSLDDGPGIRTNVFLKGCPLGCLWCSNPESQHPYAEVSHSSSLCNKCGKCIGTCEFQAISVDDAGPHIKRDLCTNCGKCVEICEPSALKMMGKEVTVDEVFKEVLQDAHYYEISGGGMTATGGEPLYQADFTAALFRLCRENNLNTCLETSGFGSAAALNEVLPYTSLVLFDIKHADSAVHQKFTGQRNEVILNNLKSVIDQGVPVIIRIPVIPGYNDSVDNISAIARVMLTFDKLRKAELMPYHKYGTGKYEMLDRHYGLEEVADIPEATLQEAKKTFESFGIDCSISEGR